MIFFLLSFKIDIHLIINFKSVIDYDYPLTMKWLPLFYKIGLWVYGLCHSSFMSHPMAFNFLLIWCSFNPLFQFSYQRQNCMKTNYFQLSFFFILSWTLHPDSWMYLTALTFNQYYIEWIIDLFFFFNLFFIYIYINF